MRVHIPPGRKYDMVIRAEQIQCLKRTPGNGIGTVIKERSVEVEEYDALSFVSPSLCFADSICVFYFLCHLSAGRSS